MNILNLCKGGWCSRRNSKFDNYPRSKIVGEFLLQVDNKSVLDLGCGNGTASIIFVVGPFK